MRRHPPRWIELRRQDHRYLEELVRDGDTAQRVARRARILLAMANPATVIQDLAEHLEVSRGMIWNLCRRYEQVGMQALEDASRSGRPREFSPPGARRD
jgi:transposase